MSDDLFDDTSFVFNLPVWVVVKVRPGHVPDLSCFWPVAVGGHNSVPIFTDQDLASRFVEYVRRRTGLSLFFCAIDDPNRLAGALEVLSTQDFDSVVFDTNLSVPCTNRRIPILEFVESLRARLP